MLRCDGLTRFSEILALGGSGRDVVYMYIVTNAAAILQFTALYIPPGATLLIHYNDVIMGVTASQITSLTVVYSTFYSDASKKTSTICVTGLCAGNSPVTGEFPAPMASNAENVSIWWRHHVMGRSVNRSQLSALSPSIKGDRWQQTWYQVKEQHLEYVYSMIQSLSCVIYGDIWMRLLARRVGQ